MVIKLEPADECRTQLRRAHPRKRSPRYAHIGVTNDVRTRLEQHRSGRATGFVQKYKVFRLVHVETFATSQEAIAREKELKFRKRDWKIKLIEEDKSRLERPVGPHLTIGVMGPGLRQDDQ